MLVFFLFFFFYNEDVNVAFKDNTSLSNHMDFRVCLFGFLQM